MKKTVNIMIVMMICISSMLLLSLQSQAYEDDRVFVEEYISWMNEDGSWTEWLAVTSDNVEERFSLTFKVGQPIRVKIVARAQRHCNIVWSIMEIGDYGFDILEGVPHERNVQYLVVAEDYDASRLPENIIIVRFNETFEYMWVVVPNDRYSASTWSRISLDFFWTVLFTERAPDGTRKEVDRVENIASFFNAYIRDEWNGPSYTPSNEPGNENGETSDPSPTPRGVPGFTLSLLLISLLGFTFCGKKRKR